MAWQRVDRADHPDRCQALAGDRGQCWNAREGVSQYCGAHGGNRANEAASKSSRVEYEANKYLAKFGDFRKDPHLMSLTMELAAVKSIFDAKFKMIQDEGSMLLYAPAILNMALTLEKLTKSSLQLQERLGNLMTTEAAMQFAKDIQDIIAEEVKGEALERIQARMADALAKW